MNYVGRDPAPAGVTLVGDTNPVGMIAFFHTPPTAWLAANGQSVLKASYPNLWAYAQAFLTTDQTVSPGMYRDVDASNFAVPNLSGLFIRGSGSVDGNHAASSVGVKQADQNLAHTHTASDGGGFQVTTGGPSYGSSVAGSTSTPTTSSNGGTEGRPVNVALVPCVKALHTAFLPSTTTPPAPPASGRLVQSVSHLRGDMVTVTATIPFDNTIPQITEGTEVFSAVGFAPMSTGSRVRVRAIIYATASSQAGIIATLFRSGTSDALSTAMIAPPAAIEYGNLAMEYEFIAASTSPFTYSIRMASTNSTAIYINGRSAAAYFAGTYHSFLRIDEYSP